MTDRPRRQHLRRRLLVLALVVSMTTVMVPATTAPAQAHSDICTWLTASSVGTWVSGQVRQNGNHAHHIYWSTDRWRCATPTGFPAGGSLSVRYQLMRLSASGCTSIPISTWHTITFTGANQTGLMARDVPAWTCYRFQWRANNAASAFRAHGEAIVFVH